MIGTDLGSGTADEAIWWYRDGATTQGPVSVTDLLKIAEGPLGPAMLVWRKTFGASWKRLDAMLAASGAIEAPPTTDYGRWTDSFAKFSADPAKNQPSWLGILGPFAYLYLGMWRRALIILSASLSFEILFALAEYGSESRTHVLPGILILSFCVRNLKRDYYSFRVLGEQMWPRLHVMRNGFACGGAVLFLVIALALVQLSDPADTMVADVAGVWQSDGANVVIDVAGLTKTITYGGVSHAVRMASVDGRNSVVVFEDVRSPKTLFTLQKHVSETDGTYSVDLLVDDQLVANLLYVRPV